MKIVESRLPDRCSWDCIWWIIRDNDPSNVIFAKRGSRRYRMRRFTCESIRGRSHIAACIAGSDLLSRRHSRRICLRFTPTCKWPLVRERDVNLLEGKSQRTLRVWGHWGSKSCAVPDDPFTRWRLCGVVFILQFVSIMLYRQLMIEPDDERKRPNRYQCYWLCRKAVNLNKMKKGRGFERVNGEISLFVPSPLMYIGITSKSRWMSHYFWWGSRHLWRLRVW